MRLKGIRQMEMAEIPVPQFLTNTDVLVRMKAVGVCGSDIHYYTQGRIGSQVVDFPFTVGHEGSGVVEKVQPGVTRVKPGDRIAIEPAMPCFKCDQCKAGRHNTCRNMKFLGAPGQADGCLSEFIVIPESSCLPVPDSMTLEEAAMCEPLSIGLYSVKQSAMTRNHTIAILGFGPIGMSVLLSSRALGNKTAVVTDKLGYRVARAVKDGVVCAANPEKEDVAKSILDKIPSGVDIVFECSGQQDALDNALDILAPGGKLVLVGIPEFDNWSIKADLMRRKELTLINIRRQNHCAEEAVELVAAKKTDLRSMATHRISFADTPKAFDMVAGYREGVMKALIVF